MEDLEGYIIERETRRKIRVVGKNDGELQIRQPIRLHGTALGMVATFDVQYDFDGRWSHRPSNDANACPVTHRVTMRGPDREVGEKERIDEDVVSLLQHLEENYERYRPLIEMIDGTEESFIRVGTLLNAYKYHFFVR